ncbi:MAG: 4Fe-4S binding protein [Holosporaceae bacterium]|nr:4Fe-4S binding protein [Holosporaceae bacterium]
MMRIVQEKCKKCLECVDVCPVKTIFQKNEIVEICKSGCLECGCCASSCPNNAIEYE